MWNLPRGSYRSWRKWWNSWNTDASISLTHDEAAFLRERIVSSHPDSLYALLLTDSTLRGIALVSVYGESGAQGDSSFHVFLSHGLSRIQDASPSLARTCILADGFSELVLGCRIAYNMQLAGLEEQGLREWEGFGARAGDVARRVDLPSLGMVLGLSSHAGYQSLSAFLERSRDCMESGDLDGLKEQVRKREAAIKGTRRKIGGKVADFAWRGGHRLPYRFTNAMSMVREIDEAGGCDA